MVKINIDGAKFLKKDQDVKHKDVVTIATEGGWEQSRNYPFKEDGVTPNNQFNIKLKLENGEEGTVTLSWTNVKLLTAAFGDETADWVGKEVRAWKTKSERAKSGFTFIYAPKDWVRDETGEWVTADGTPAMEIETKADAEVDDDAIDPKDIPF